MSDADLSVNVVARKRATEVLELASSVIGEANSKRFWEIVARHAAKEAGLSILATAVPTVVPMTDAEAKRFQREVVRFGKYQGRTVGQVPASYWLALTDDTFNAQLRRYVTSKVFSQLQFIEDDDDD